MGRAARYPRPTLHRNQGEGAFNWFGVSIRKTFQYSSNYNRANDSVVQKVNFVGNNLKSMHLSVKESLKRLRTDYIDILYVHWWDWETSIEEVMRGLHNLVSQGKVLYLVMVLPLWYR